MNPQLARLLFPKSLPWHVTRAVKALFVFPESVAIYWQTYSDTWHEVMK